MKYLLLYLACLKKVAHQHIFKSNTQKGQTDDKEGCTNKLFIKNCQNINNQIFTIYFVFYSQFVLNNVK